jgi:O-antigen/teichoic acid export membrane protein
MAASLGISLTAYFLVRAMNSQMRNKEALRATLYAVALNILANVVLWQVFGPEVIGISFALYNLTLLFFVSRAVRLLQRQTKFLIVLALLLLLQLATHFYLASNFAGNTALLIDLLAVFSAMLYFALCLDPVRKMLSEICSELIRKIRKRKDLNK